MTVQIERSAPTMQLCATDRLARSRAMTRDYEAFLAPGERFAVDAEAGADYVWTRILLGRPDDTFRLDLEAAVTPNDYEAGEVVPEDDVAVEQLLAFLRIQLYEFFRSDRVERFHVDWRLYAFDALKLRFRGNVSRPALEREADSMLGEGEGRG